MTFEAYARDWLERQNFIKSTRKWTRQGLEVYDFPVIGSKELSEISEGDIAKAKQKYDSQSVEDAERIRK